MWTKQYIFNPTKEEYFKSKHPVATSSMLMPVILYYLIITLAGADQYNWFIIIGAIGCLVLGAGLAYGFAVKVKIYQKTLTPALCFISGMMLIILSLLFLFW